MYFGHWLNTLAWVRLVYAAGHLTINTAPWYRGDTLLRCHGSRPPEPILPSFKTHHLLLQKLLRHADRLFTQARNNSSRVSQTFTPHFVCLSSSKFNWYPLHAGLSRWANASAPLMQHTRLHSYPHYQRHSHLVLNFSRHAFQLGDHEDAIHRTPRQSWHWPCQTCQDHPVISASTSATVRKFHPDLSENWSSLHHLPHSEVKARDIFD